MFAQPLPITFVIPKPHVMYCGNRYTSCLSCVGALLQCRGRVGVTLPIWVHTRRSLYLRGKHQTAHMVLIVASEGESAVKMLFSICPPAQADMHNHVMSITSINHVITIMSINHVMSCHVMSCHVMSCHVMSCHVMSIMLLNHVNQSCLDNHVNRSCMLYMPPG